MSNRTKQQRNRGRAAAHCLKGGSITARWESSAFLDPAFPDSSDAFERDHYRKAMMSLRQERDF